MPDLSVEVRGHEIVVTKPSQGLKVTYRKLGRSPMLMADDLIRKDLHNDEQILSNPRGGGAFRGSGASTSLLPPGGLGSPIRPCTHKSSLVSSGWSCPLCPQKRTFVSALSMSALCQQRTRALRACTSTATVILFERAR